jgi:hypothetical protein
LQGSEGGRNVPDENLAQVARELLVNVLLRVGELDVHVAVDADQPALVLGLAPLESHYNIFVDAESPHR